MTQKKMKLANIKHMLGKDEMKQIIGGCLGVSGNHCNTQSCAPGSGCFHPSGEFGMCYYGISHTKVCCKQFP